LTTVSSAATSGNAISALSGNFQTFLTLLMTQLKNQDPTKPVDNTEYVAQMAQFSALSGITQSNDALGQIIGRLDRLIAATSPAKGADA
jgi:flagellar basal-body rod modification protein FlgD